MADFQRLTRVRPGNLGNLGFLPLEVCNKIYAFLLADFDPPSNELELTESSIQRSMAAFALASHSIDTAILRASRNVHLEAYDLMVKKNRFVRFISRGVPKYLLSGIELPIVTVNADIISRFKGYVLEVTVTSDEDPLPHMPLGAHDPFEAMILARDTGTLCIGLMAGNKFIPGFADRSSLTLNLGLVNTASHDARDYKDLESLKRYFSDQTQRDILEPFRRFLYGVQNIEIGGVASDDVASWTREGAASGRWGGPQQVLDYFAARKEAGLRHLEREETRLAAELWFRDATEITALRTNKQWARFVQEGGEHFITRLADIYFRLNLNCAHLFMGFEGDGIFARVTQNVLENADQAMTTGYWDEGFTWQPPRELRAKLHFRTARSFRLRGDPMDFQAAMSELDDALQLCPGDSAILTERRLLSESILQAAMTAR